MVDHPVVFLVRGIGEVTAEHLVQADEKLEQAGFGEGRVHVLRPEVDLGQQLHGLALLVRRIGLAQVPVGQPADFAVRQAGLYPPLDPQPVGGDLRPGLDVLQQGLQRNVPLVQFPLGCWLGGLNRLVLLSAVGGKLNFSFQPVQQFHMNQLIFIGQAYISQIRQLGQQGTVPKIGHSHIQLFQLFTVFQKGEILMAESPGENQRV